MSIDDKRDFARYCKSLTTAQVQGVIEKESASRDKYHQTCAKIAKSELEDRRRAEMEARRTLGMRF